LVQPKTSSHRRRHPFPDGDVHYTERYIGLPQDAPQAYEKSSVLSFASGLERPLLAELTSHAGSSTVPNRSVANKSVGNILVGN
jgi:hypothetical protein